MDSLKCVDNNVFCSPKFCSSWSKAQTECSKTCNPQCQKITPTKRPKATKPPRTTKAPRYTTPKSRKPPKMNSSIAKNSPCQDNAQYQGYCGQMYMSCDSMLGKLYCMRSCGLCGKIDKMFVCKDQYPEYCHNAQCNNVLARQYCQKTCKQCLKPAQFQRDMNKQNNKPASQNQRINTIKQTTKKKTRTTRKPTTRKPTTRRPVTQRTTITPTVVANNNMQCIDNPNYANICRSTTIDCNSMIIKEVCKQTCGFCRTECPVGYVQNQYSCDDEDECLQSPCQVCNYDIGRNFRAL